MHEGFLCFFPAQKRTTSSKMSYNFVLVLAPYFLSNIKAICDGEQNGSRRQKEMLATDKFLFLFFRFAEKEGESPRSFLKEKQAPCCIFCSLLGRRATKRKLTKLPPKIDFFLKHRFFTVFLFYFLC